MSLARVVIWLVFALLSAMTGNLEARNVDDAVDSALVPVYTMTNFFLGKIIQVDYLTKMEDVVDLSTIEGVLDSFPDHWGDWVIYLIGFAVCAALGVTLLVVLLFSCCIFPCCRCCGHCGGKSARKRTKKTTRCCTIVMSLFLGVISIGLLLAVIPMFGLNERLRSQLSSNIYDGISDGLGGVDSFLNSTVEEMNATFYLAYLDTEEVVFKTLDNIPQDSLNAFDDVLTKTNQLQEFAGQLENLQENFLNSDSQAKSLVSETENLQTSLDQILADIKSELSGCAGEADCDKLMAEVDSTKVSVDFGVIDLDNAITVVNGTIAAGNFGDLVDGVSVQLKMISDQINSTTDPIVGDIKQTSENVGSSIYDIVDEFDDLIKGVDIASAQKTVLDIKDIDGYKLAIDITYGVMVGLSCVLLLIIFFYSLGMLLGWILKKNRNLEQEENCCTCTKSVGYHLLLTGTSLTLFFYWLFALLVFVMFVFGGVVQTEMCRNLVSYDNPKSSEVLSIFDGWINDSLSFDIPLSPFASYVECENNVSTYQAFHLDHLWNLNNTAEENVGKIKDATDQLKEVHITLIPVTIANPNLIDALTGLDGGLGSLDFSLFYTNIEGNITEPDLQALADDVENLGKLKVQADALRSLYNNTVKPIQSDRDVLDGSLRSAENIVNIVSFSDAAESLTSANEMINFNGSDVISGFINSTADGVYNEIYDYTYGSIEAMENDVARCEPLYASLTTIIEAACVQTLYPLNGWWFCLGWCMFFLVPGIFLAVNLASTFRYESAANGIGPLDTEEEDEELEKSKEMQELLYPPRYVELEAQPGSKPMEEVPYNDVAGSYPTDMTYDG